MGEQGSAARATGASGRERVLDAAYELFSRRSLGSTGVDAVIAQAGVAKMTLYRNFRSKDDLALAFLERREERWTHGWLAAEATRRGATPAERLLAIFDVLGEWFAKEDFEGCTFVKFLLELDPASSVRDASIRHLGNVRTFLGGLAAEAGIQDPDGFAHQWHILMKGSTVSAVEGDREAAGRARGMGELLLRHHGAIA